MSWPVSSIVTPVVGGSESAVVVDHRERASGVPAALESLGVSVTTARLRVGDYAVGPPTRVERKTVRDLHASVVAGRFWAQLNQLRTVSAFPVVLVEGSDLDAGPLPKNGVRGVLVAVANRGIPVLRSTDAEDSARWIRSLAWARSTSKRVRVRAPYRRPIGTRDPTAVAMLCAIPTISVTSARALVDAFGTLHRIAIADIEDLSTVRGMGKRRSQAVYEAFNQHV